MLILDEVIVEVSDISDGIALQLSNALAAAGGYANLTNLLLNDFSNTSQAGRLALFNLMKNDGLFNGLSGIEAG